MTTQSLAVLRVGKPSPEDQSAVHTLVSEDGECYVTRKTHPILLPRQQIQISREENFPITDDAWKQLGFDPASKMPKVSKMVTQAAWTI